MAYKVKRTTSPQNKSLKKGNLAIGNEKGDYGTTSTSGFVTGVVPSTGGHILVVEDGTTPNFYSFANDSELINYYNIVYSSVATLQDVIIAVAGNNSQVLISSIPVSSSVDVGTNFSGSGHSSNSTTANKLYRLKNNYSDNKTKSGLTEWVAVEGVSGVNYCAIYPGTKIYEIRNDGTYTQLVSSTSSPQVGTINVGAGRRYVGTKPVHFMDQASQHVMVPLSYKGYQWGFYYNRYDPQTVYVYGTEDNTTVKFWKDSVVTGTIIQDFTIDKGDIYTFSDSYAGSYYHLVADKPIVASSAGSGDKMILPQASTGYSYRRYNEHERTLDGTGPSFNGTYVIQDPEGAWAISIADGDGGDSESSVPLEYLTDTYCFGAGPLRSYFIVAPYASTAVTCSYWNGSSWTQYNSHSLSGTLTSPAIHSEGGQNGSTNLVDGTTRPWKWEGNNPYYIVINDGSADEEALFGWNRDEGILSFSI